jgi:protocatechuate 3,4-dioxygenase beta subunit
MKMFSRLLAGSLFFAGMYSPLLTQTANTALRGSVSDPSGAVVSGAIVNLQNLASGQQFTKKADARGEYVFSPIVPGEYLITVSAAGFAD